MYNLTNIYNIKKLLKNFNFSFKKNLGQNFILNKEVTENMAQICCGIETGIIEIGSGIGTLTYELAKKSKKVVTFEVDNKLIPILNKVLSEFNNVKIINKNILNFDFSKIIPQYLYDCNKICVCANLPYYLTSELILKILKSEAKIDSLILMIQKEVAERICAKPNKKTCGAITFSIKYYADSEILFNVPKENFIPQPKVNSSVIKITPNLFNRKKIYCKNTFFNVVNTAFKKRRKNILNSLSSGLIPRSKLLKILNDLNLSPNLRAENLSFEDFTNISNKINSLQKFNA